MRRKKIGNRYKQECERRNNLKVFIKLSTVQQEPDGSPGRLRQPGRVGGPGATGAPPPPAGRAAAGGCVGGASAGSQCGVRWIMHIETHVCDGIDKSGYDFPRARTGNRNKTVSKTQNKKTTTGCVAGAVKRINIVHDYRSSSTTMPSMSVMRCLMGETWTYFNVIVWVTALKMIGKINKLKKKKSDLNWNSN